MIAKYNFKTNEYECISPEQYHKYTSGKQYSTLIEDGTLYVFNENEKYLIEL
jgi:hypothetical protein